MPNSPIRAKSDLELLREKNVKERDAFFVSLIKDDPDFKEVMETLTGTNKPTNKKPKMKKSNGHDPSFRCSALIPVERRRSSRLQNKEPDLVDSGLDSENYKRKRFNRESDDYYNDLEEIVYEPKKSRSTTKRSVHHIIPTEKVEDTMIENIAKRTSEKIYSEQGSSCHQCRQKTMDQKTCCRNVDCIGVRGQFCGICLYNRYGELASEALKDPNWHCPVCRGICNCSFCRAKAGKRPTGILTPMAHQAGHKSVKDFLDSLRGEGDYPDQDNLPSNNQESNDLLGFSNDGSVAYMSDIQHEFVALLDIEKMKNICREELNKLTLLEEKCDESPNFLGFYSDSHVGLLENNIKCEMKPLVSPNNVDFKIFTDLKNFKDIKHDNDSENIKNIKDLESVDQDEEGESERTKVKIEMNSTLLEETQSAAAVG